VRKNLLKIIITILILFLIGGMAEAKKPKKKKKRRALIETTQLGKNKLYFSKSYQKKLKHRTKKNRRAKHR